MKEGEIINENEIVLPVTISHVVAAGIGGKEKDMKTEEICWSILKSIMVEFFTLSSEEGKNRLINVINNDFREILNAWDRDKVRTR